MTEAPEPGENGRIDVVLSRLVGVRRSGSGFRAYCPVHENGGKQPGSKSERDLAIDEGRKGVALYCFSGCRINDVRQALDLTWKDLFYEGPVVDGKAPPLDRRGQSLEALTAAARLMDEPEVLAKARAQRGWAKWALENLGVGWDGERFTLPITDEKLRSHDVLRYDPYVQKMKMLAGKGRTRLPFPAPEHVETRFRARGLFLVEGEGTAISVEGVRLPVVGLPGAIPRASGDVRRPGHFEGVGWHKAWARRFKRFGRIWLFPDSDDVGRTLMRTVGYDLMQEGVNAVICDLGGPKGYDLGDFLRPAVTTAHRRQGRDLLLMFADIATRKPEQLDEARQLMFAWNGWLLDGGPGPQVEMVPEPEPVRVLAPGQVGWV